MTTDEWLKKHREEVDSMTLARAREVVAAHCAHDDMRIEFEKAVKMLLDCADREISQSKWIPVDWEKYPEGYPKPFQEVWITTEYGVVVRKHYGGEMRIKAWMPCIVPEPYKEGVSK